MSRIEPGRLLVTLEVSGAVQMGWDRALLDAAERGATPATLRLSTWRPGAISIGWFQDPDRAVDVSSVAAAGLDLVRRPTGGRAVLHLGDLTYTLVARRDDPGLGGARARSLRVIGEALAGGLARLGIEVRLDGGRRGAGAAGRSLPPCFVSAAREELRAGGRKVLGSARLEGRRAFLQHGSLPLTVSPAEISRFLSGPEPRRREDRRLLLDTAQSLQEATGRRVPLAELTRALPLGFEDRLGRRFVRDEPRPSELDEAARLAPLFSLDVPVGPAA